MSGADPLVAIEDRFPLARVDSPRAAVVDAPGSGIVPFGLRHAVRPIMPTGRHEKTYYSVTVKEATHINKDGTVVTVQDDVVRERED